jgi:hypothetical protein
MTHRTRNLLLLFSAATLLTACGNPNNSSLSSEVSSTIDGIPATAIAIPKTAPRTLVIGQSIDVAQYLNYAPENATIQLIPKSANVAVEGTTITAIALGDYSVEVRSPGSAIKRNYSGTVISQEQKNVQDFLSGVSKNYTAAMSFLQNGSMGLLSYAYHNENYFAIPTLYWDSETNDNDTYSGIVDLENGDSYQFTYNPANGSSITKPGKMLSTSNYALGGALPVSGISETLQDDGSLNSVIMTTDAAESFVRAAIGFSLSGLINTYYAGYSYHCTLSYKAATESSSASVTLSAVYSGVILSQVMIWDVGATSFASLDQYREAGTVPTPLTNDPFVTQIKSARDNHTSYQAKATIALGYEDNNGKWVDLNSSDKTSDGYNALEAVEDSWGIKPATYTAYTDNEKTYSVNEATNAVEAYLPHDGSFYRVNGTAGTDGTLTYTSTKLGATSNVNLSTPITRTIVDNGAQATSYLNFAWASDEALQGNYTSVQNSEVTVDDVKQTVTTGTSVSHGDEGNLFLLMLYAIPQTGWENAYAMQSVSSSGSSLEWYDYMGDVVIATNQTTKTITISSSLARIDYLSTGYYVMVRYTVEFSNFGTATVPTDWETNVTF